MRDAVENVLTELKSSDMDAVQGVQEYRVGGDLSELCDGLPSEIQNQLNSTYLWFVSLPGAPLDTVMQVSLSIILVSCFSILFVCVEAAHIFPAFSLKFVQKQRAIPVPSWL